jgi:hypothetical protein
MKDEGSKKRILEEILTTSQNPLFDKDRPFTPPFTKLVPMGSLKSLDNATLEKSVDKSINQSIKLHDGNNYMDLIYDHVLGCYYDPKTNIYYELKDN